MINIFVSIVKEKGKRNYNGGHEQTRHVNYLPEDEHVNVCVLS